MLFNSFQYILGFFPICLCGAVLLRRIAGARAVQVWVLACSLVFYGWSKPENLAYLLGSIAANWALAKWMDGSAQPGRKRVLQISLLLNICYLCLFKYFNFFLRSIPFFAHRLPIIPDLEFPLGISFFTLMQVMYLVDTYEELNPASSLLDHATFTSFFPYVISGPISKSKRILHQFPGFGGEGEEWFQGLSRGLFQFSMGLCKKVVFADAFGRVANFGYGSRATLSALEAWTFALAYTLQIYFDFSGYTDMAIGSAAMLGIQLPRNFDAPLKAKSIIEFWQRWHISLTGFITTYLYTPIVQSFRKVTLFTSAIATILAMSIAGLWHGPNWTFLVFGLLHGLGLALNQVWRKKKFRKPPPILGWVLTFALVLIAQVFFRSSTLALAMNRVGSMFRVHGALGIENLRALVTGGLKLRIFALPLIAGLVLAFVGQSSEEMAEQFKPSVRTSIATIACLAVGMVFLHSIISSPFLYFAF